MQRYPVMSYSTIVIWLVLVFFSKNYYAMRIVVQRVRSASVTLTDNQSIASAIGPGLLALVGLHQEDTLQDLEYCCKKLLGCKLWENESGGQWRHSVKQKSYDCLCVSQFTLYATLSKKHQPDYKLAMKAAQAEQLYQDFIDLLKREYSSEKIHNGVFGAMMDVSLVNDGPVTIVIDSRDAARLNGKIESQSEDDDCL